MTHKSINVLAPLAFICAAPMLFTSVGRAQTITHQIALPAGESWCDNSMINGLFSAINNFRVQNGVPALKMDPLGMKDAEIRATQFLAYMAANRQGSPGFNPHTGYDTTAASLGYNLISENLSYMAGDPNNIVYSGWQDGYHLSALLARGANIAGVSCVNSSSGIPYWTYEPGCSVDLCGQPPLPPAPPANPPAVFGVSSGNPTLDSEELAFLTLINNYRAQNGAGALQVSVTLENSSLWMSNDMAMKNYASHTDSLGRDPGTRFAAFNYPFSSWGENIEGGSPDAQSNFNGFVNACDPGPSGACTFAHRNNMLTPGFKVIGIGRAFNANSTYGWYWVTDFGGVVDQTLNTSGTPPPVISGFMATPATITKGQVATLSWSVSGAATITIDNGVGDVSSVTSKTVSPASGITYTLTASNSGGSVTAKVAVAVNITAPDTQPPSTPSLTSAVAKTSAEVDLSWTASTDNVGVSGYQVLRNGVNVASLGSNPLSFADTGVVAASTYTYSIRAFDAAGNYSSVSNGIQVTTPSLPGGGGTYSVSISPATVAPGGNMNVSWTAPAGHPAGDWLGLYAVGAPFFALMGTTYTGGANSGTVSIPAPRQPGQYELRFYVAAVYIVKATSNPVTVSPTIGATGGTYSVSASPASVQAGASIAVVWNAPSGHSPLDWVGLYAPGAPAGSYQTKTYLGASAGGTLSLTAPAQAGSYEIRLSTNDSLSVAATSAVVMVTAAGGGGGGGTGGSAYSVTVSPTTVAAGQGNITVSWTAPGGHSSLDWLGLYAVDSNFTRYYSHDSTGAATSGTFTLPAPAQAGQYEIRFSTNGSFSVIATSAHFTVTQ